MPLRNQSQTRQSLQLCGKLLFAQFEEMVNVNLNVGLSPNLCGGDHKLDFGFKGFTLRNIYFFFINLSKKSSY